MSIGTDSQSNSQYLSTSTSSLNRSKKASSEVSKTYKHASQLYLTRRLLESYESLQTVIKPLSTPNGTHRDLQSDDELTPRASIATATTSQRIKIWSLYATLLNAVVDLGDEEGKQEFGSKLYREIVRNVQSGTVWEQVVKDGYMDREGSVDAEVVYNLSNLLLAQAPNQTINQNRLETYLSSSPSVSYSNLDLSMQLSQSLMNGKLSQTNGTDTPKDLNSRIKILELFTLHVLPRNEEWDYAKSFISNSDILDDERREAFMQTLQELHDTKLQEDAEQDLDGFEDAEENLVEDNLDGTDGIQENGDTSEASTLINSIRAESSTPPPSATLSGQNGTLSRRTNGEGDYGIEDEVRKKTSSSTGTNTTSQNGPQASNEISAPSKSTPTESVKTPPPPAQPTNSAPPPRPRPSTRRPNQTSKPTPSSSSPSTTPQNKLTRQARKLYAIICNLTSTLASSISTNPAVLFRTLMFIAAFLMVLSRREIRERVKRVIGNGWGKVKGTVGMGVKVSYI